MITTEELQKYIEKKRSYSTRTSDQKSYKIGKNSGIYQERAKPDPDNRIPVPFVRRAVKLVKGYFAKVGNITYGGNWFPNALGSIYNDNDEEIETAEIFEDSITYGSGFEAHWYNAEDPVQKFRFALLPIDQCIPIYSDDVKPVLIAFIWYRQDLATYWDATEYADFVYEKDKWVLGPDGIQKHLYGRVPVLEANTDRDKRNMFDHCLPLIDLYDKILSEVGNEHEKFAQSVLLLRDHIDTVTKDENGLTEADKIKLWKLIDGLGDNVNTAAAYLQRNVNDSFINNSLDRIERLIYEMLCIFNPNDDSFATASGIAQAYKLLGFELSVADMESYFSRFLQERIYLISGHALFGDDSGARDVSINFKRNLPFDMEKMASIATILSGGGRILSEETILGLFPSTVVSNKEAEAKRVKEESKITTDPLTAFGLGNVTA